MTPASVHYRGRTRYTRTQAGRRLYLRHDSEISLELNQAVWRFTNRGTGESIAIPITDRMQVFLLYEADLAMLRTARKNQEVMTNFKPAIERRRVELMPPKGYQWCPLCLGCLERSQTCPVCDGDRAVRSSRNDDED